MQIDLKSYFNHTIRYNQKIEKFSDSEKSKIYGVNKILLAEDLDAVLCSNTHMLFNLEDNIFNIFDNIVCDGQKISIFLKNIKTIGIMGFTDYGTVSESMTIIDFKNARKKVDFVLKTFHTNPNQSIENYKTKKCTLLKKYMGNDGQKHNVFSYDIDLDSFMDIKQIILPINLSIHIMAIVCT